MLVYGGNTYTLSRVVKSALPTGKWENEESVYTFNADGSGEIISKDGKTGVPLMYEVSADTTENNTPATYEMPDENTLVLVYGGSTYTLSRVVKSAFPTGKWENGESVYTFNEDGSGEIIGKDGKTGVALTYEVSADTNEITMHIGSAENNTPATYETPDENTLVLVYGGNTYTLARSE